MVKRLDPYNLDARIDNQIDRLLSNIEKADVETLVAEMSMPQYLHALYYVARVLTMQQVLRKANSKDDSDVTGSAVRTYSRAFEQNASRGKRGNAGRIARGGLAAALADVDDDEHDGDEPV